MFKSPLFVYFKEKQTDLIFAVITDVVHAHEDGQKLPVLLEVQTLMEGQQIRSIKDRFRDSGTSQILAVEL